MRLGKDYQRQALEDDPIQNTHRSKAPEAIKDNEEAKKPENKKITANPTNNLSTLAPPSTARARRKSLLSPTQVLYPNMKFQFQMDTPSSLISGPSPITTCQIYTKIMSKSQEVAFNQD